MIVFPFTYFKNVNDARSIVLSLEMVGSSIRMSLNASASSGCENGISGSLVFWWAARHFFLAKFDLHVKSIDRLRQLAWLREESLHTTPLSRRSQKYQSVLEKPIQFVDALPFGGYIDAVLLANCLSQFNSHLPDAHALEELLVVAFRQTSPRRQKDTGSPYAFIIGFPLELASLQSISPLLLNTKFSVIGAFRLRMMTDDNRPKHDSS
jgi:hypothetical protein